jgi:transposase
MEDEITADTKEDLRKYNQDQLFVVRKSVVRLFLKGYSQRKIAEITGMNLRRVSFVIKEYKATGKVPHPEVRGRKAGEKRLLSPAQEKEIKRLIVDKNPNQLKFDCFLWTANTVRELVLQRFGIKIGKTSIVRYLESWGMSVQRPSKQCYRQNLKSVEVFIENVYPSIKKLAKEENAEIYFGDETGVNNQAYNPAGYAPRNHPPVVKVETSRETVNMLSAVSMSGEHKFMLYDDSTTQQKLMEFMDKLIADKKKDKVYLILDNLKVHHGKLIQAYIEKNKTQISVFYFPSYSPELNPDEYLNNVLKMYMHTGIPPRTKAQITEKMKTFMESLQPDNIQKLFNHPKLSYQNND